MGTANIRSLSVCALQNVNLLITVLPFDGAAENCLRNTPGGRILQADHVLLADSLRAVRSATIMYDHRVLYPRYCSRNIDSNSASLMPIKTDHSLLATNGQELNLLV
jgi:hypothetical protein